MKRRDGEGEDPRIYIDMAECVDITGRNERSRYACKTELQTAPKLELEFSRVSPSSRSFFDAGYAGKKVSASVFTFKKCKFQRRQ